MSDTLANRGIVIYPGLLLAFTAILAVAKVVGLIDWGWHIVLLPIWGPWALLVVVLAGVTVIATFGVAIAALVGMYKLLTE